MWAPIVEGLVVDGHWPICVLMSSDGFLSVIIVGLEAYEDLLGRGEQ